MNKDNKKQSILKPCFYNKNDPKNPKNINADEVLNEARKRREEELKNKRIVIDNNYS